MPSEDTPLISNFVSNKIVQDDKQLQNSRRGIVVISIVITATLFLFAAHQSSMDFSVTKKLFGTSFEKKHSFFGSDPTASPTYSVITPPSDIINLTGWALQMPVNATGGFSGTAFQAWPLTDFIESPYFHTSEDGAMVMWTPSYGARVSSCSHPRCELFQADTSNGDNYWWNISTTYASMEAKLAVNSLGQVASGGNSTVIVAQIHGVSGTEIRLYYDENGTIYWEASIPKDDDVAYSSEFSESKFGEGDRDLYTYEYLISSDGNQTSIPLNSKFSYRVSANTTYITAKVWYDGVEYVKDLPILFFSEPVHFKAGSYCQTNDIVGNSDYGTGACQVSFYKLTVEME